MGSVNKVILVGNLGRDAELRYTPGGAAVSKFSVIPRTIVWASDSALEMRTFPPKLRVCARFCHVTVSSRL